MAQEPNGPGGGGPSTLDPRREGGGATATREKVSRPERYKVILYNDDYTPMEFVIGVLEQIFGMGLQDATRIMLHVHQRGIGVCGVFTYEVAESKVAQVIGIARKNQHPLQCTLEKDRGKD